MPATQTFAFSQDVQLHRGARVVPTSSGPLPFKIVELDGVCAALSGHYLKWKLRGQDPQSHLRGLPPFDLKSENEKQAMTIGGKKTNLHTLDGIADHFGWARGYIAIKGPLNSAAGVLEELQAGTGLLFAFNVGGRGGHACAAYRSRGKLGLGLAGTHLYVFDPNHGEYKGTAQELAGHLATTYPTGSLTQKLLVRG